MPRYRVNIIGALHIARERGSSPLLLLMRDGVRYVATEFSHDYGCPIEIASAADIYPVVRAATLRHAANHIETEWALFWHRLDLVRLMAGIHTGIYLTLCDVPGASRHLENKVWVPPAAISPDASCSLFASAYLAFLREAQNGVSDAARREIAGIPLICS